MGNQFLTALKKVQIHYLKVCGCELTEDQACQIAYNYNVYERGIKILSRLPKEKLMDILKEAREQLKPSEFEFSDSEVEE